jgi:hypothetical protein
MNKADIDLLARVAKEETEHGLEFKPDTEDAHLHKVIHRLIKTPPTPKAERGKREKQQRGRKRQ